MAEKILARQDQLEEIFEAGLHGLAYQNSMLYEEIIQFFSSRPSLQEILNLKPSQEAQERIRALLEKNRGGKLSKQVRLCAYSTLDVTGGKPILSIETFT